MPGCSLHAQRRPGPEPRQHVQPLRRVAARVARSTKAGTGAPATPPTGSALRRSWTALNEGRDRSPGNTGPPAGEPTCCIAAQRRPGPEPRQHAFSSIRRPSARIAQRRPGPEPRQHADDRERCARLRRRSTKAGTGAPATHLRPAARDEVPTRSTKAGTGAPATQLADRVQRPAFQRSTKAGTGAPATRSYASVYLNGPTRAQRRPGPEPRQHSSPWCRRRSCPGALNEGRDRSPGNTGCAQVTPIGPAPLNEGRDRSPGNTAPPHPGRAGAHGAQRRPGPEPRQHAFRARPRPRAAARSTKAGTGAPATPMWSGPSSPTRDPLNEGRDRSPGNTLKTGASHRSLSAAQRRPGPEPRQHASVAGVRVRHEARSTKAGTGAPATRRARRPGLSRAGALNEGRDRSPGNTISARLRVGGRGAAQRRPGPEPRQHRRSRRDYDRCPVRSTKAGTGAPATLRGVSSDYRLEPRSTKAGTGAPATPTATREHSARGCTLNEGRDRSPGNTCTSSAGRQGGRCAQRRPGPEPRQHPPTAESGSPIPRPLNEGRDRSPGNTPAGPPPALSIPSLNEGRDRSPGNTRAPTSWSSSELPQRSTKAGTGAPATPDDPHDRLRARDRSTKAGTGAPATRPGRTPAAPGRVALNEGRDRSPGNTHADADRTGHAEHAQRRPGPEPRQHARLSHAEVRLENRSTKAGTGAPATRAADRRDARTCSRSTKAGTGAPATHDRQSHSHKQLAPLNEGRDRSPGNTGESTRTSDGSTSLNEGRDRSPGNTRRSMKRFFTIAARSTKAGTGAPATRAIW